MKLLKELLEDLDVARAPSKTERYGTHYEFIIGIGDDNTATITLTEEAYVALFGEEDEEY